jgi:hypothetical protein
VVEELARREVTIAIPITWYLGHVQVELIERPSRCRPLQSVKSARYDRTSRVPRVYTDLAVLERAAPCVRPCPHSMRQRDTTCLRAIVLHMPAPVLIVPACRNPPVGLVVAVGHNQSSRRTIFRVCFVSRWAAARHAAGTSRCVVGLGSKHQPNAAAPLDKCVC